MILAGDFRKGATFEYEGKVWTIVDFQHVKPGKGAAFVRTKMKNVIDGSVLEKTWNPTEKVQEPLFAFEVSKDMIDAADGIKNGQTGVTIKAGQTIYFFYLRF